jgi:hypothetical protein
VRRIVFVPLAVIVVLVSGCKDPNTTSYDPVGAAAADADINLVPQEQVAACVESTKFGAYVGDPLALERWNSADQSDDDLAEVCTQIWHREPTALAAIHSDWMATQALIAASP